MEYPLTPKEIVNAPISPPGPLILVADDDRALRKLLTLALDQEGYRSVQVGSGEQVLQDFQRLQPDLVLLDAVMPERDGFDCCHQLRTDFHTEIPILMVTVLDDQDSIDRAFAVGATDYITKPIHWAVLRQRVKRLLHSHQAVQHAQQVQGQLDAAQAWETLQRHLLRNLHHDLCPESLLANTLELFRACFDADQVWIFQSNPARLWTLKEEVFPAQEDELLKLWEAVPAKPDTLGTYLENTELAPGENEILGVEAIAQTLNLPALLMAPIVAGQTGWGWLLLGRQTVAPWTATDQARLQDLTRLLAIALPRT